MAIGYKYIGSNHHHWQAPVRQIAFGIEVYLKTGQLARLEKEIFFLDSYQAVIAGTDLDEVYLARIGCTQTMPGIGQKNMVGRGI